MKIRCVGIDDHQTSLDLLENYVQQIDYLHWVRGFNNPALAVSELDALKPDLIFLDMQMPKMSGLEFLQTKKPQQPVIIISDYKEFAFDSYTISNEQNIVIVDYLAKIITFPRFMQACEKAKKHIQGSHKNDDHLLFAKTSQNKMEQINMHDMQYIEADEQEMVFFSSNKEKPICKVRITMAELEERLQNQNFIRLHRKYLINPRFVSRYEYPDLVIMHNTKELSVGKTYQPAIKEYFSSKRLG